MRLRIRGWWLTLTDVASYYIPALRPWYVSAFNAYEDAAGNTLPLASERGRDE